MKRNSPTLKVTVFWLIFAAVMATINVSWAALTIFDTDRSEWQSPAAEPINDDSVAAPKTRAPEPSTLALLGSGIIGMMISFVRNTYYAAKRFFDILSAILAMILLSPLFLFTAILIKLTSKGPVIFKQVRVGKDGKFFEIYKFRTMRVDAEKHTGPVWAKENDPRLIPVGKFLRRAHIDEIPQFVNVLKGDMSLIGPRPERPVFVEQFKKEIPDYEKRLTVKPGITGLAQVWHKYDESIEDVHKKIKYDVLYIKKLCFLTDLRILWRTVRVVFTGEGAH